MPKEFTVEGEVGWDIGTSTIKDILAEADGEDILINFASPGGSVFTGLKMYNLIKGYSGNVDFHLIGEAASMGSYIPLAGRTITAEPNAVYMIHNARSFIGGDHNDMRKRADIIEGLSNMLRDKYVQVTGKSKAEITDMMDAETYLFGQEIVDAGFIDSVTGDADGDPDARGTHVAVAREAFEAVITKLQTEKTDDYEQAAAIMTVTPENNNGGGGSAVTTIQENKTMTKEELKAKHPELYAELVNIGVMAERDRVTAHLTMGEASGDNKTAVEAIKDGSEMTATLQAKYMAAGMNRADINARGEDDAGASGADSVDTTEADAGTEADTVASIVEAKLGVKEVK